MEFVEEMLMVISRSFQIKYKPLGINNSAFMQDKDSSAQIYYKYFIVNY